MGLFGLFKKKEKKEMMPLEEFFTEEMSRKYYNSCEAQASILRNGAQEVYKIYTDLRETWLDLMWAVIEKRVREANDNEFANFYMVASQSSSETLTAKWRLESREKNNKLLPSDYVYLFLKKKYHLQGDYEFCSTFLLGMWVAAMDKRVNKKHALSFLDSLDKEKNPLLNYYEKVIEYHKTAYGTIDSFTFQYQLEKYWKSFYGYLGSLYVANALIDGVDTSNEAWLYNKKYFDCATTKFTTVELEEIKKACKDVAWLPEIRVEENCGGIDDAINSL